MLFLYLFLSSAFAANVGSITLSGVIPAVTNIVVTGQAPYDNLDLTQDQNNLPVATVREISNSGLGYTVTASSANAGKLKNGAVDNVVYTAKYNNVPFALTVLPVQVTSQGAQVGVINVLKSLTISYTGASSDTKVSGTYTDTITLTIQGN
jgi:hypothetical protein